MIADGRRTPKPSLRQGRGRNRSPDGRSHPGGVEPCKEVFEEAGTTRRTRRAGSGWTKVRRSPTGPV